MEISPLWMFLALVIFLFLGLPLGFALGGTAAIFGLIMWGGPSVLHICAERVFSMQVNYLLIALPLFIFMGSMLDKSGVAEKLFGALHIWMGGLKGGLAVATVIIATIFAAATGVVGASVTAMGIIAFPEMLKRKYNVDIAAGSVMASGCLGILIPPSIMLVVYGSFAQMSVGQLFMAAICPGLLLASLYMLYILVRCNIQPKLGPALPAEARRMPVLKKTYLLVTSIIPPVGLIVAVLGAVFFGVATPSEAAAIGAVGTIIIAASNRTLTWDVFKNAIFGAAKTSAMINLIAAGAICFTAIFLGQGGGILIKEAVLALPLGKWAIVVLIMFVLFILGMFLDWMGIIMILLPIYQPIIEALGLNPLWFATMVCVNLQMSFLTPPFGYALFYLKAVAPPGSVQMTDLIRAIIPFLILIVIGLFVVALYPQVALWLPEMMIS